MIKANPAIKINFYQFKTDQLLEQTYSFNSEPEIRINRHHQYLVEPRENNQISNKILCIIEYKVFMNEGVRRDLHRNNPFFQKIPQTTFYKLQNLNKLISPFEYSLNTKWFYIGIIDLFSQQISLQLRVKFQ